MSLLVPYLRNFGKCDFTQYLLTSESNWSNRDNLALAVIAEDAINVVHNLETVSLNDENHLVHPHVDYVREYTA